MQIKNTTDADILHKNSGINFAATSYTPISANALALLADDQTFTLFGDGSFILNDGVEDIASSSNSWNAINKIVPQNLLVTTQYELNNKDLKLAKAYAAVDAETKKALVHMKIPGEFGSGLGRYVEGGYATTEDYEKDDYVLVWVSDEDRNIAWLIARAMDPSATEPVSDDMIKAMGPVPGIGFAMPNYPVVKTYHDDDADAANAGWYFWPIAQGHSLDPVGETEVESIAGYAFCPSGLYLNIQYCRTSKTTGGIRINFLWGKLG